MLLRSRGVAVVGSLVTITLLIVWAQRRAALPSFTNFTPHFFAKSKEPIAAWNWQREGDEEYLWRTVTRHFPVETLRSLPTEAPKAFPRVQATFDPPGREELNLRQKRQDAVRDVTRRTWYAYRKYAWGNDELEPVSGLSRDPFGGWAATLVDALDTLYIMGLETEFKEAVAATDNIDFTRTTLEGGVNLFETNIRYLGGFLGAFDVSGDMRLLRKAAEVGEMIHKAFDTPNHMPIARWSHAGAAEGKKQNAQNDHILAEIGSMCLELTRLSQLTGNPKFFDASQRVMDALAAAQDDTALPGQWPLIVDAESMNFTNGGDFSLGAMADSTYEYLPKMAALLGGTIPEYEEMYNKAIDAAIKHNLFRPLVPDGADILFPGVVHARVTGERKYFEQGDQMEHLACYLGGLMALGGRMFERDQDLIAGTKLTEGCMWAYANSPRGVMPETFFTTPCESKDTCPWDESKWKNDILKKYAKKETEETMKEIIISGERLSPGFTRIADRSYRLRPEAAESVFILHRITADPKYADAAWDMFAAVEELTRTEIAYSAVKDVTVPKEGGASAEPVNSMESFWLGETLKYFYLTFSVPDVVSLDEFVFNTEAHPFRRTRP